MQVGNIHYLSADDLPEEARLFPLEGALLLPGSVLPLNIFEPRYLQMFDDAMSSDRIIGMIQPSVSDDKAGPMNELSRVGTLGRILSISESGDGRYSVSLGGICRFRLIGEKKTKNPYLTGNIQAFASDLEPEGKYPPEMKIELLNHFYAYVEVNEIEVDNDEIRKLSVSDLVNLLTGIIPFDPAEKQALLEADFDVRVPTLIALIEMNFSSGGPDGLQTVQ